MITIRFFYFKFTCAYKYFKKKLSKNSCPFETHQQSTQSRHVGPLYYQLQECGENLRVAMQANDFRLKWFELLLHTPFLTIMQIAENIMCLIISFCFFNTKKRTRIQINCKYLKISSFFKKNDIEVFRARKDVNGSKSHTQLKQL